MSEFNKGMVIGGVISTTSLSIGLILAKLLFIQPTIQFEPYIPPEEPQTILVNSIKTTNSTERANTPQNLNWFKENNQYIWDGWKIK